jgi:hypothetical protein
MEIKVIRSLDRKKIIERMKKKNREQEAKAK